MGEQHGVGVGGAHLGLGVCVCVFPGKGGVGGALGREEPIKRQVRKIRLEGVPLSSDCGSECPDVTHGT